MVKYNLGKDVPRFALNDGTKPLVEILTAERNGRINGFFIQVGFICQKRVAD